LFLFLLELLDGGGGSLTAGGQGIAGGQTGAKYTGGNAWIGAKAGGGK